MDVDELMRQAATCAQQGDLAGEVAAYQAADELGDADAAVLLGNALRRSGETASARFAYERGEQRGHPEAAMSLGNLLSDIGDHQGAKAAYLRSIGAGSTLAHLNLGLMLADAGELEEACQHLEHAAASGDPSGFWGLGRIHEQREDWAAAAGAYAKGAALDDAKCAYGHGAVLYRLGDRVGAKVAFELARDLGHDGIDDLLAAFEAEEHGPTASDLWSNVNNALHVLASQRRDLGRRWIEDTLVIQETEARTAALRTAEQEVRKRLATVAGRFGVTPEGGAYEHLSPPIPTEPGQWVGTPPGQGRVWELASEQARAFDSDLDEASAALRQAESRRLGFTHRSKGVDALQRVQMRLEGLANAVKMSDLLVRDAQEARSSAARAALERARGSLEPAASLAGDSARQLPRVMQPWSSPTWQSWTLDDSSSLGIRLSFGGVLIAKDDPRLGDNASFGSGLETPWGFRLHDSWWLQHDGQARERVHGFVRSMMLRHLLTARPGEVEFCIFDPVGLGQSAGAHLDLAEYDPSLIGGKVWTTPRDLQDRLDDLSAHIELVIQKYLRTTYNTIDEFNEAAGEVAEPYRVLVLFDFPHGLSAESAIRLKSIVENGPRCGVFTMACVDASVAAPYDVDLNQLRSSMSVLNLEGGFTETIDGYELSMSFMPDDLSLDDPTARRIIDAVGRASVSRTEAAITFEKVFGLYRDVAARGLRPELGAIPASTNVDAPDTWWQGDSTTGLFAPIGQKGARDVAILGFDSSDRAGALLVGRPGSGKSTLLHTYLGGLTTLYSPEELELYLIDFKEGVEFKAYAEEELPHARVIAIESDREFGLSVLESIQAEIGRRADLLRSTGGRQAGMQGLRQSTGDRIARILLVFDEFQVLFSRNDKIGLAAADLLESIIRQGRGFGVHVLLGSQSLAGLDALGAHVPQLLPVRILLPATQADGRKVLGDGNNAGDYLTTHGEGVLNSAGGAVEANERFKGALLAEHERIQRLQTLRKKATESGMTRVPMVFEGNELTPLQSEDPSRFVEELTSSGTSPLRLRVGVPMTVGDVGDLALARDAGAHVLAIVKDGTDETGGMDLPRGPAYGLLSAAVASVAATTATIDVIDFLPNDDGMDALLEPLLDAGRITLKRRRAFPDVLEQYEKEVKARIDEDDARRPALVLFLFGVHRARDLNAEFGNLDADAELVERLEFVMRDGPEVGVHVWLWADSVAGAARRLTSRMMREVGWRIAGRMSGDDSQSFVNSGQAVDLRDSQILMVNEDHGASTRMTAFAAPPPEWLTKVLASIPTDSGVDDA